MKMSDSLKPFDIYTAFGVAAILALMVVLAFPFITTVDPEPASILGLRILGDLAQDSNFMRTPAGESFRVKLDALREANSVIYQSDYDELMKIAKEYDDGVIAERRRQARQRLFEALYTQYPVREAGLQQVDVKKNGFKRLEEEERKILGKILSHEVATPYFGEARSVGISPEDGNNTVWLIEKP
jgi:hypothetical protein